MNEPKDHTGRPPPPRARDWIRIALPVLLVAGFIAVAWKMGYFDLKHPDKLNRAAEKAQDHPWFGAAFVAAYAAIAAFAAPVSPLAYAAGAMFGVIKGSLLVWIGSMLGATAGYWLAHGVWFEAARRLLGSIARNFRTCTKERRSSRRCACNCCRSFHSACSITRQE
jgi:uncharacterized membrane protein YdjX (TVP38/TMEM64 family)